MANYPGTKLVGVAYKLRKKMKNSPSCVHVLHKTLNVVISRCCFAGDDKEMYQNVNATLSLPSSLLKLPFNLVTDLTLLFSRGRRRNVTNFKRTCTAFVFLVKSPCFMKWCKQIGDEFSIGC